MKRPFPDEVVLTAIRQAKDDFPKESCGFILENDYVRCENIAENPVSDFEISPEDYLRYEKEIKCVFHSHVEFPHASKADMEFQITSNLPWCIINFNKNKAVTHEVFWGDQLPPYEFIDLLGRQFFHGIQDCYGLVRDYYRTCGYILKQYPREWLWWERDPSMLLDNIEDAGFYEVDDEMSMRMGDLLFFQIDAPVPNHCGVYLGNGLILHHLAGALSCRQPLNLFKKYMTTVVRHTNEKDCTFIRAPL